ncbi:MAG: peptidoglycan binding protein CsiV [Gammaproteobacteria bacterium]|nr:peptidoglycan binding protein CsiV [Gammaproteobacteria bacterium]MDH3417025.1 peptidoglycan binding protein CsiV [Gammaproteobacteria bacterium]
MKVLTTILFLSMAPSISIAQDDQILEEEEEIRRYTVELIVFSYAQNVSVGTEIFPRDEPIVDDVLSPDYEGAIESDLISENPAIREETALSDRDQQDRRPVFLREEEFTLSDIAERFRRLDVYETIMHVGWTQRTYLEEETRAIELWEFGDVPEGLDGRFTLYLNRYLHLAVDLSLDAPGQFNEPVVFDEPDTAFGDSRRQFEADIEDAVLPVRYRIQDDRIFKNGDVRYFDHPKFGIVVKITRVEEEELEELPLISAPGQ